MKEITFRSVLVDNLFSAEENDKVQVYDLVEKDLRRGVIQPLHATVFEVNELEKAYRYLSTGKHVGKGTLTFINKIFICSYLMLMICVFFCNLCLQLC